jgi:hypothetical protein
MNNPMDQLVQIENNIKQAYTNDAKGLIRLHLAKAIALSQELTAYLTEYMLGMESIGEQPREVYNFAQMPNIDSIILDL